MPAWEAFQLSREGMTMTLRQYGSRHRTMIDQKACTGEESTHRSAARRARLPKSAIVAVVATCFALTASEAGAGQIYGFSWYSGVASVAGTSFAPPVAPNNDDVAGTSPNSIFVTQKDYTGIGPVDLVFDVLDTGGVTEYLVIEGVFNNTGLDWSSYHIELGFGEGAGFVKSTSGDGLDFDAPDYNSDFFFNPDGAFFPDVAVTEDDIFASGGVMADFTFAGNFLFHIDVPDGITQFTIRQSPVAVPEPGTVILAGMGLFGLARKGARRAS
jgi:hypothetical protein